MLMQSGYIDACDIEVLTLCIFLKFCPDNPDIGVCKAEAVNRGENADSPAVGERNGPDLLIIPLLCRELFIYSERAAHIIVAFAADLFAGKD